MLAINGEYSDAQPDPHGKNTRIEHDRLAQRVIIEMLAHHTELFKQYCDNPDLRRWLSDANFAVTCELVK